MSLGLNEGNIQIHIVNTLFHIDILKHGLNNYILIST